MIIDSRYEIIETLGSGIWATVYKVRDLRTKKIYALKLFDQINAEEFYEKLPATNMHHITQIKHPNLARIRDFGNVKKNIYAISDYYDGIMLTRFPFNINNISELYDIIIQISYALNALHTHGIIHKDLKPHNILYKFTGSGPEIKVLDFGFSKIDLKKDPQKLTGSLPFIAPEIYLDHNAVPESDFYSLGVTLYRLTTGAFPFSVKQITSFIQGSKEYLLPKLPRQINKDIPEDLEKLIIKLLEKDPENRFRDAAEIIEYINSVQVKDYPFSFQWSTVNYLQFNSYYVNEVYSEKLTEYTLAAKECNGKLISLIGGMGLGKGDILTLFKYHILNGDYLIFDYKCNKKHNDPFYALTREFRHSVKVGNSNAHLEDDLLNISSKFKKFLNDSEESARSALFPQEDKLEDFASIKNFISHLSEAKPLIFIIRQAELLDIDTINFINYCADTISTSKIMIVLSFNNYTKLKLLRESVVIKVPVLTYDEAKAYINRMFEQEVPETFINKLYKRTSGNPHFIKNFIIFLTVKKKIWDEEHFNLDYDLDTAPIPPILLESIYERMNHLSETNYKFLVSLSVVQTPLNKDLIKQLLSITDLQLFSFITDAINNELLIKRGEFYYFTFPEAKNKFFEECSKEQIIEFSKKVIDYFYKQDITLPEICDGIIKNAELAEDYTAIRKFNLKLFKINNRHHKQDEAFQNLIEIININISEKIDISEKNLIKDAILVSQKINIVGSRERARLLIPLIKLYPEIYEKYLILIKLHQTLEEFDSAMSYFSQAEHLTRIAKHSLDLIIIKIRIFQQLGKLNEVRELLDLVDINNLNSEYKMLFIDRKSVLLASYNKHEEAIDLTQSFLEKVEVLSNESSTISLAVLHNNLGTYYSTIKRIDDAQYHISKSISIFERYNISKQLVLIYNNFGDIFLKQGLTHKAYEFFKKSEALLEDNYSSQTAVLTYVNIAEVKVKFGKFIEASELLYKAKEISDKMAKPIFRESILTNLAIIKGKTASFAEYTELVYSLYPNLKANKITEINPLVKTYFYYLYDIRASKSLTKLIQKNNHIRYSQIKEQEFYYNALHLAALLDNNYEVAYRNLDYAKEYSDNSRNIYASAIFMVKQIECLIHLGKLEEAETIYKKVYASCEEQSYDYWRTALKLQKCKMDLLNPKIHLRNIIRELFTIESYCSEKHYRTLEIKTLGLIIQIYNHFDVAKISRVHLNIYKGKVEALLGNISKKRYTAFLKHVHYYAESPKDLIFERITLRANVTKGRTNTRIAELLQLKDINRIKFFFDKLLHSIASPDKYLVAIYNSTTNDYEEFTSNNFDFDDVYTTIFSEMIDAAFSSNKVVSKKRNDRHIVILSLQIRSDKIGFIIIEDNGELPFTKNERELLKNVRLQMTTVLLKIIDFKENYKTNSMMHRLMKTTQKFMSNQGIEKLEQEIIAEGIQFLEASRGLFIRIDDAGNYRFKTALDDSNNIIRQYTGLDNSALLKVQQLNTPLSSINHIVKKSKEEKSFKSSSQKSSYYCAPISIENKVYAILYFDNYHDMQKPLYINREIMNLFILQVTVSLKNTIQYNNLIAKNLELVQLDTLKDDFINIVSHELNTPLTKLSGYVARLKNNVTSNPIQREELLTNVDQSVNKLINTTNDIITLNRFNMKTKLIMGDVDLYELADISVSEARFLSKKRKMTINLNAEDNLPHIYAEWESINIMLNQILLNAIRFTRDFGEISVGIRKSIFQTEMLDNAESIVMYIKDNGIGIPEKELKNVFKKFYELNDIYAHQSGTIEYKSAGLGLGLSTCEKIVELHSGKIWINSTEHEGTTVFVALPIFKKKLND